jgi:hypothetical protein
MRVLRLPVELTGSSTPWRFRGEKQSFATCFVGLIFLAHHVFLARLAIAGTNGTTVLEDGAYTVSVAFGDKNLTTIEPNRRATYTQVSPSVYDDINTN